MSNVKLSKLVDQLGEIKREISSLEEHAAALRQMILDQNVTEVDGEQFHAVVYTSASQKTDWKAVVAAQKETPKLKALIVENTRTVETVSLKVTLRS